MQRLKLVLAALLALPLVTMGCGRQQADTRGGETAARTDTSAQSQAAQGSMTVDQGVMAAVALELGKSLSPDGDVTGNTNAFRPGEPVFAEIQASQLSPGSSVRLSWVSPQGATLSTDELVVPQDARVITLKAKDTSSWTPGTYHVDLAVGGASVGSKTFTIGAAGAAD